jgi:hypothetical protein
MRPDAAPALPLLSQAPEAPPTRRGSGAFSFVRERSCRMEA